MSTSGDQVLAYEGTTAPTTNSSSLWLYGFSLENWVWGNNANTSDIPTALTGAYVGMTSSTTEYDNAYFANGSTSQTSVSVTGTQAELLALFNDSSKYFKNDSGPLTFPTYSVSVSSGGVSAPTTQASSITFSSVQQNQMTIGWTIGDGTKRVVIMNTSNSFTDPSDGTDPTADTSWNNSGEQVVYNFSGNSETVTGLTAGTTYWFRIYEYNGSGTSTKYLTSTATNNPNSQQTLAPAPLLTVSTNSLSGFTYTVGSGPSTEQSFTVSGDNLIDDLFISATGTDYEISETSGGGFNQFITLTPAKAGVSNTTIYVRLKAGLVVGDYADEIIDITSEDADAEMVTCAGSVTPQRYFVDFEGEGEVKTSYTTGTVTLSGINWDMTEALIGDLSTDWKNGVRSARMRGYGTSAISMLENKTTGAGNVSFKYRRYGTDTQVDWKVEYSTNDGGSWTQLGSSFTAPASDVVQTFSEDLNLGGNVRVRIKRATESGTSNARLNIDDIALTDYYDYPAGIPVVVGDETITVSGGNANNGSGTPPAWTNPSFTPSATYSLTLIGAGPWTVTIATTALWGAFYQNGQWYTAENVGGSIVFNISAVKDQIVEIILGDQDPTLPVELSSFTATMTSQNLVSVMWVTQSETNVNGYYVYRGMNSDLQEAATVSPLIPATNTSQQQMYQYTDSEVFDPGTYYYWLQVQDLDGSIQFHGPTTVYFDNGNNPGTPVIPKVTELKSVYPNPFNPSTTISYSLAKAETVDFVIFNSRGQIVRSFNEGNKGIGNHSFNWFGDDQNGKPCSTGVYFIKMNAGKDSFIRKAVLMK
jgi:hypothetical protein